MFNRPWHGMTSPLAPGSEFTPFIRFPPAFAMAMELTLTIQKAFAQQLYSGTKLWEIRAADQKLSKLDMGSKIVFHWYSQERLITEVIKIVHFQDAESMLTALGPSTVLPGKTFAEAMAACGKFKSFSVLVGAFIHA